MRLATYLAENDISFSDMARRVGAASARTVERHAKGQRVPSGKYIAAYHRVTAGAVTADDHLAAAVG